MSNTDSCELRDLLREELKPLHDQIVELDHAVRGNGRPGLNQRVALLEASGATMARLWWTISGVVVAIVTTLATKILHWNNN